jgi:hypothetical protein
MIRHASSTSAAVSSAESRVGENQIGHAARQRESPDQRPEKLTNGTWMR